MIFTKRTYGLNFALQGGGAHGAFTWGVLDRLLEEEALDIGWISGTSAGALNAVALVSGLATGGRSGARAQLREMWEAIYKAGVPDFLRFNPLLYGLSRSPAVAQVASLWSPYEFNPLGFDPLRQLIINAIDIKAVRAYQGIELLIAATEVATGRARLFRRHELSVDVILASACLPTLHHAVAIDGVAYWDGGFSANPDIVTLAQESPVHDTLIVQINPLDAPQLPKTVRDIASHANRLTFNAPLLRDIAIIAAVRETRRGALWRGRSRFDALARHRFHLIEAGRYTSLLSNESKHKPDWGLFTHLFGAGRTEAAKWLDAHLTQVGRRETVDLVARYLGEPDAAMFKDRLPTEEATGPPKSDDTSPEF